MSVVCMCVNNVREHYGERLRDVRERVFVKECSRAVRERFVNSVRWVLS